MRDNTIVLVVAEIVLGIFGAIGLVLGNDLVAVGCMTAMGSLVAGHLNGTERKVEGDGENS